MIVNNNLFICLQKNINLINIYRLYYAIKKISSTIKTRRIRWTLLSICNYKCSKYLFPKNKVNLEDLFRFILTKIDERNKPKLLTVILNYMGTVKIFV